MSLVTNLAAGMTRRAAEPRGGPRGRPAPPRTRMGELLGAVLPRV